MGLQSVRWVNVFALIILMSAFARTAPAQSWSGHVSIETRSFFAQPGFAGQSRVMISPSAQPDYRRSWGTQGLVVVPFFRWDSSDSMRTHFDIRELLWHWTFDDWELRAGIGRVFWGVTESQHLVDIINQTDFVENMDAEDKLGQPMVNVAFFRPWGNLDLFVLPGFRKRTFPGAGGRLRLPVPVETELAEFGSSSGDRHIDLAVRWSQFLGDWDFGLSHFWGTGREPELRSGIRQDGTAVLIPFYEIIHQTGLDVQATKGAWLWKFEGIHRATETSRFGAITAGFEYTFSDVAASGMDVGLLGEYLFDGRGDTGPNPFEDDLFVASRLELNDSQSTRVLAGVLLDRDAGSTFVNVEASRRLWNAWTVNVEGRMFMGIPDSDALSAIRDDDHLQLEVGWYF